MESQGLNSDVSLGGREFHVETSYVEAEQQLVSRIFLSGQVISTKESPAGTEGDDAARHEQLQQLHNDLITEIEILYYISEKVKAVRHAPSAIKLGQVFLEKSLHEEAEGQLLLALEIEPTHPEALGNLGKLHLMTNRYDEAIEALKRGAEYAPEYADIQNYLGVAYLYKEDYPAAIEHLGRAIELSKNYIGAHYHLGVALLANYRKLDDESNEQAGDELTRALESLEHASERFVNHQIGNFDQVMALVREKAYDKAVDEFLLSKPADVLSRFFNIENEFYLKFMYGGKGKDEQFISTYVENLQRVIREHPDYADARNNLGVANLIQCRNLFLRSLDEFRAALKINPAFRKAEKNLKLAENDGKGFLILLRAILK